MACVIPRPGEAIRGPGRRLPPGILATPGDEADEQANCSPRLARAGRRTLVGCRSTVGAFRSRFFFVALCRPYRLGHARRLPGPRPEVPDLQRAVAIPDESVDIPRLASGSRSYTVSQYKTLPGYGKTLPPLPSYIASESSATEAAVIYAPGSSVNQPAYDFPETPLLYFFEGGAYREISFQTVPGDQFIGGSSLWLPRANLQRWRYGSGN